MYAVLAMFPPVVVCHAPEGINVMHWLGSIAAGTVIVLNAVDVPETV